jgi:hypothetical protein
MPGYIICVIPKGCYNRAWRSWQLAQETPKARGNTENLANHSVVLLIDRSTQYLNQLVCGVYKADACNRICWTVYIFKRT